MTKIIMLEDFVPEEKTITGFVDCKGNIWADKNAAKYASATHRKCEKCGEPVEKTWVVCRSCREKAKIEKYNKLPIREWKGEPLYSEYLDRYFFDSDLEDYLYDENVKAEDLRLVFCEPEVLPQIQIENWDLYEDYEISKEVIDAVAKLNELLAKQPPHCWYPGKVAARVSL